MSVRGVKTEFVFGRHAAADLPVAYAILVPQRRPAYRGLARKEGRSVTSAAIYARVSSARQKKDQTIGSQTAALREHAAQNRLEAPEEWVFEDEGHSGATLVRPVPAIVTQDIFERVQQRLADNKRFAARNTKVPSLLQGLAACTACGYGSAGIPRPDPFAAGLALRALTGPLLEDAAHRRSSGPSLTAGCAVPAAQPVLRPPPTPTRPAIHFPGSPVIGRRAPVTLPQATGPGRASPVPAATIDAFRAPYAGESRTAALPGSSPLPWPSP